MSNNDGQSAVNLRQRPAKHITTIEQWSQAMRIYGSIYLQAKPSEIAGFFQYMEFMCNMSKKSTLASSWIKYDELFRKAREQGQRPWNKPFIMPYINALTSHIPGVSPSYGGGNSSPGNNSRPPFRGNPPRGHCFNFQNGSPCKSSPCQWLHLCTECKGPHGRSKCTSKPKEQHSHQPSEEPNHQQQYNWKK